jgi:formamidopyrimidine-DNA glycosylase
MPELPEVETIARGLAQNLTGDIIESVWLGSKPEPLKSPAAEIVSTLEQARIAGVRRVGKHIVVDLSRASSRRSPVASRQKKQVLRSTTPARQNRARRGPRFAQDDNAKAQWIVHLGMTGRLLIAGPEHELPKHTHAVLRLRSGRELRFVDPRRFGRLAVVRNDFQAPGSEPLDVGFESFANLFRKRKTPIKSALLNQGLLSGIGNIYADESLFRAGVRPRRRAAALTRDQIQRLYDAVREVLREAIAAGGSSVSDYVDSNGDAGFFQFQHRVYGREGEPCLVCRTPIKRVVIAGRSAHYCPNCQK